ncbi:MAG: endolytic transglycosylase MltG [Oscillospiraceae bacterium]|jgi:UPF0755 protein|nr:endolytic transglycosylase MltG [Oscillospiraceae bacterium]
MKNRDEEPFRLDISFDNDDWNSDLNSVLEETPARGEVYFSNQPRRAVPAAAAPQKNRPSRTGIVLAALLVAALLATTVLSYIGITFLGDVFAMGRREEQLIEVTIGANQTTDQIIDELSENRLIRQTRLCKLFADFSIWIRYRKQAEKKQPEYLAGKYSLSQSMGLEEMLNTLKSKPKTAETKRLTFPEGYTARQIIEKVSNNNVATADSLRRAIMETQFDYPFLANLNLPGRYYQYEGYLFPDTYDFFVNDNVNSVLHHFFDNFQKKWIEYGFDKQAEAMNWTMDNVIIFASIIQKEAATVKEMPKVSRILHNRMANRGLYPLLECDSTRDYVLNNIGKEMDAGSVELYNQAYNTYKHSGLPVGPICNPGIDAIDAALNPSEDAALDGVFYFQHDKNGKIYIAKTKAEHNSITTKLVIEGLAQ